MSHTAKYMEISTHMEDLLENVLQLACMYITTQQDLCLHEQIQIVANAACRVGSHQFLSYIAT